MDHIYDSNIESSQLTIDVPKVRPELNKPLLSSQNTVLTAKSTKSYFKNTSKLQIIKQLENTNSRKEFSKLYDQRRARNKM